MRRRPADTGRGSTARVLATLAMVCGLGLIVSCGLFADDAGPVPLEPDTAGTASTFANPTTSETTTTTAATTSTTSIEDAVLEVHNRFMTEAVDESTMSLEQRLAGVEDIAVDPLLTRIIQRTTESFNEGEYLVGPGYESNVVDVEINGDTAQVTDCSLGRGVLYGPDGSVIIPADEEYKLRQTRLVSTDAGWFVSDFFTGGDLCDPDA